MIKTEVIWHEAKDEMPERNGKYLMLTKYGLVDTILYAEGKWNAFIDEDDKLHDEGAFAPDSGYVQLWAEFPKAPALGVIA
jgi:hypothetical protein